MERTACEKGQKCERIWCVQGTACGLMCSGCSCMGGNESDKVTKIIRMADNEGHCRGAM